MFTPYNIKMEEETTKLIKTSKIIETTKWYTSEKKQIRFLTDEILCRVIVCDDCIPNDY